MSIEVFSEDEAKISIDELKLQEFFSADVGWVPNSPLCYLIPDFNRTWGPGVSLFVAGKKMQDSHVKAVAIFMEQQTLRFLPGITRVTQGLLRDVATSGCNPDVALVQYRLYPLYHAV